MSAATDTARAASDAAFDARAPGAWEDAGDETETRPSQRRLQNERSRVIDQLTAEAASSEAARVGPRSVAASPPQDAQPARLASQPAPVRARRPWASLALFGAMLALSLVPLLRYALSHEPPQPVLPGLPPRAHVPAGLVPSPTSASKTAGHEAETTPPEAGREQQLITLIAAGNRALEDGAVSDAERLFGRVIELDEDNPRAAYGLARVRLTQGNLSGAEGWIQLALRKRPRRRAYHALYAEVLMRLGRTDEAREEERHTALTDADEERAKPQRSDAQ